MMSSASKPTFSMNGTRRALSTSLINETCPWNSSGDLARLALYSAYCSARKVALETSKATARWVGCSSRSTLMSIAVNP